MFPSSGPIDRRAIANARVEAGKYIIKLILFMNL